MEDSAFVPLRAGHALFNFTIFILFIYQAYVGITMRRSKRKGAIDITKIQKHKRNGPIFATLAILGYLAGLIIVTLDQGKPFTFPPHFIVGTLLIGLIITTFIISRLMTNNQGLRNVHFGIGITILTLYVFQIMIGARVLSTFQ